MRRKSSSLLAIRLAVTLFFAIVGIFLVATKTQAWSIDPDSGNSEDDFIIDIYVDTVWHKTDDLNFNKIVFVNPGATLTIEKGAKIKFGKDIQGNDTNLSVYGGRIVANGTQEEPIEITADANEEYKLLIEFNNDHWEGVPDLPPSFLRHVEIFGGGYEWDTDCRIVPLFGTYLFLQFMPK